MATLLFNNRFPAERLSHYEKYPFGRRVIYYYNSFLLLPSLGTTLRRMSAHHFTRYTYKYFLLLQYILI